MTQSRCIRLDSAWIVKANLREPTLAAEYVTPKEVRIQLTYEIGFSTARPLIVDYDIKTRAFYGNTSMEAEMGFLLAGQALVR